MKLSIPFPSSRRFRRWRFRLNPPLLFGSLLVLVLLACALAAPLLAPFDPMEAQVRFNGGDMVRAPYPPGAFGMPLGSDTLRRDLLSRLIYGSRYTLLFCGGVALVRVLLGVALGMLGGWYRGVGRAVDVVASAWSAIPSLVFAIIPISIVNTRGSLPASIAAFAIAMSLTGWPEITVRVRVAVEALRGVAFVDAAYALGQSRLAVLWRHVLPNLRDLLLVELSYAAGAVMLLIAELGFLGVYVGDAFREEIGGQVVADPIYAEWGGMLARGLRDRGEGWWLFLVPVAAFTLGILAFNLLAEGLRRRR
jgi:peptide/nickel transport system permease protein